MLKNWGITLFTLILLINGILIFEHIHLEEIPLPTPEKIDYIRTLAETEIFDANHNVIGVMGENQTFAIQSIDEDFIKPVGLPFYFSTQQIIPVDKLDQTDPTELDLSRYLPFDQVIAKNSTVHFYHLDSTFAFTLTNISSDIEIFMEQDDKYYVKYLDTYFMVNQDDVQLTDHPNPAPEATVIPVLMYHFFCNSAEEVVCQDNNWIEIDDFRDHLQYLQENDFTTLKMIDIERFLNNQVRLPQQSVAITIDDGHPTVFTYAYPALAEFNQAATVFAIANRNFDVEALREKNSNVELHSHSYDMHRGGCDAGRGGLMLCIDFDKGVADLEHASELLSGSTAFAFPFGDYDDRAIEMLQAANYTLAFTTRNGLVTKESDALLLPRLRISTETGLNSFRFLVNVN